MSHHNISKKKSRPKQNSIIRTVALPRRHRVETIATTGYVMTYDDAANWLIKGRVGSVWGMGIGRWAGHTVDERVRGV